MALDNENIVILNYNQCDLIIDSGNNTYMLNASKDGIHPTVRSIPMLELKAVASTSKAVEHGWIMFEDNKKEEIYKELFIEDWKNILSNKEIEEILINQDLDGLDRILAIDNITYFDRVRMVLYNLMKQKKDITFKITNLIDRRYVELQNKQRVSKLSIRDNSKNVNDTQNQVAELSAQNASLKSEIDELKAMMKQMIASQNLQSAKDSQISSENEKMEAKPAEKKSSGRPKKS